MTKKILGIGNAIVDVFVKVDDNFLSKNKLAVSYTHLTLPTKRIV